MNDNLLSDIESDIDGDWKNIQKEILKKEINEKGKEIPKRMRFPSYKDFYRTIYNSLHTFDFAGNKDDIPNGMNEMLRRILYENMNEDMPESFEKIWEMFCSPREYDFKEVICKRCDVKHTIFYQEKRYSSFNIEYDYYESRYYNEIRDYIRIFCPNCSEILLNMTGCYLIGVFQIPKIKTKQEERRYEFKL